MTVRALIYFFLFEVSHEGGCGMLADNVSPLLNYESPKSEYGLLSENPLRVDLSRVNLMHQQIQSHHFKNFSTVS